MEVNFLTAYMYSCRLGKAKILNSSPLMEQNFDPMQG